MNENRIFIAGFGCNLPKDVKSAFEAKRIFEDGSVQLSSTSSFSNVRTWSNAEKMPPTAGFVQDVENFDSRAFGISPRVANEMAPQVRMALQESMAAVIDSKCSLKLLQGIRTGVYAGAGSMDSMNSAVLTGEFGPYTMQGSTLGQVANTVSFYLNLNGPSVTVDTACSSSMVALDLANTALKNDKIDAAIVLGVNELVGPTGFYGFGKAMLLSPTGSARPFHKDANGYVRAEGCVAMLLLKENFMEDSVKASAYAELVNTGTNQNGKHESMTKPSGKSQYELFANVLEPVLKEDSKIAYIEAHGTGTQVGDPIELNSINKFLDQRKQNKVPVGASKANFGHLETGAGAVGVLRTCLAIASNQIFPIASLKGPEELNPKLNQKNILFPIHLTKYDFSTNDYCVVNSFGYGGTNSMAVLRKPDWDKEYKVEIDGKYVPFLISTPHLAENIGDLLPTSMEQALSLQTSDFNYNVHGLFDSKKNTAIVQENNAAKKVALLFAGRDKIIKRHIGVSLIHDHGYCTRNLTLEILSDSLLSRLLIVTFQIGLVDTLRSYGFTPYAVAGHSAGEIAAAYCAGMGNHEIIIKLCVTGGSVNSLPDGAMYAVFGDVFEIMKRLPKDSKIFVSGYNAESAYTVSCAKSDAKLFEDTCEMVSKEIKLKFFVIPHINKPFHCSLTNSMKNNFFELEDSFKEIIMRESPIRYISSALGREIEVSHSTLGSIDYWWTNIENPVYFEKSCKIIGEFADIVIEVGYQPALYRYIQQNCPNSKFLSLQSGKWSMNNNNEFVSGLFNLGIFKKSIPTPRSSLINVNSKLEWKNLPHKSVAWKQSLSGPKVENLVKSLQKAVAAPELTQTTQNMDWLNDHKIANAIIYPASFMVSKLLEKSDQVENAQFLRAILVSKSTLEPMVVAKNDWKTKYSFQAGKSLGYTIDKCDPWIEKNPPTNLNWEETPRPSSIIYAIYRLFGYSFGSSFKLLKKFNVTRDRNWSRSWGTLKNDDEFRSLVTVIDASFQTCCILSPVSGILLLPKSIGKVRKLSKFSGKDFEIISTLLEERKSSYLFEIFIYQNGNLIVHIEQFEASFAEKPKDTTILLEEKYEKVEKLEKISRNIEIFKLSKNLESLINDLTVYTTKNNAKTPVLVILYKDKADFSETLGYLRALRMEIEQELKIAIFPSEHFAESITSIPESETEFWFQEDNTFQVRRLVELKSAGTKVETSHCLEIKNPGDLGSLSWVLQDVPDCQVSLGQIKVRMIASALNFKDVMLAMGLLPGMNLRLGIEGIGKVILGNDTFQQDEYVYCIDLSNKNEDINGMAKPALFSETVVVNQNQLLKVSKRLTEKFEISKLAGFLGVASTAWYCLVFKAKIQKGDCVLIHSALGGVGQMAVQIAQYFGAIVWASAGSGIRRKQVSDQFGIPIDMVLDSHDCTTWAEQVKATKFDIILNSLSGRSVDTSLRLLKANGRFLEIGKRDMLEDNFFPASTLINNVNYFSCHLDLLAETESGLELIHKACQDCLDWIENDHGSPPKTTFLSPIEVIPTFRKMAQGKHEGKLVFDMTKFTSDGSVKTRAIGMPLLDSKEKLMIFTGGTSGLGLQMVLRLLSTGFKNILLVGRADQETFSSTHPRAFRVLQRYIKNNMLRLLKINIESSTEWAKIPDGNLGAIFHFATNYVTNKAIPWDAAAFQSGMLKSNSFESIMKFAETRTPSLVFVATSLAGTYGSSLQSVYSAANVKCTSHTTNEHSYRVVACDFPIILGAGRLSDYYFGNELLFSYDKIHGMSAHYEIAIDAVEITIQTALAEKRNIHASLQSSDTSVLQKLSNGSSLLNSFIKPVKQIPVRLEENPRNLNMKKQITEFEVQGEIEKNAKHQEDLFFSTLHEILELPMEELLNLQDVSLTEIGLDSLSAMELKSRLLEIGFDEDLVDKYDLFSEESTLSALKAHLGTGTPGNSKLPYRLEKTESKSSTLTLKNSTSVSNLDSKNEVNSPILHILHKILELPMVELIEKKNESLSGLGLDSLSAMELKSNLLNAGFDETIIEESELFSEDTTIAKLLEMFGNDVTIDTVSHAEEISHSSNTSEINTSEINSHVEKDSNVLITILKEILEISYEELVDQKFDSISQLGLDSLSAMELKSRLIQSGYDEAVIDEIDLFHENTTLDGLMRKLNSNQMENKTSAPAILKKSLKKSVEGLNEDAVVEELNEEVVSDSDISITGPLNIDQMKKISEMLMNPKTKYLVIRLYNSSGLDVQNKHFSKHADVLWAYQSLSKNLFDSKKPIFVYAEGSIRGGSMAFPLCASVTIVTRKMTTNFGFPEVAIGGLPAIVSSLSSKKNIRVTAELFTSDPFDIEHAMRIGIVDRIVEDPEIANSMIKKWCFRVNRMKEEVQLPSKSISSAICALGPYMAPVEFSESSHSSEPIKLKFISDDVALLEFDDQINFNAMTIAGAKCLKKHWKTITKNKNIRGLILLASPNCQRWFCTGLELRKFIPAMKTASSPIQIAHEIFELYDGYTIFRDANFPVISILSGKVVGGGLAMALHTDFRILLQTPLTSLSYGNLERGVCPGLFLSKTLVDLLGYENTIQLYRSDGEIDLDIIMSKGIVQKTAANYENALSDALDWLKPFRTSKYGQGVNSSFKLLRRKFDMEILYEESLEMAKCIISGAFTDFKPISKVKNTMEFQPKAQISATEIIGKPKEKLEVFGIEKMEVYVPEYVMSLSELEKYNNADGRYTKGLSMKEFRISAINEDAASMAMSALKQLLEKTGLKPEDIGRLEVGTESMTDKSKSIKSSLMNLFGSWSHVEGADIYHACYGGTAAVFSALDWLNGPFWNGKKAVVICTDIARFSDEFSYLNGAAAVAILLGNEPSLIFDSTRSTSCHDAYDFFKPMERELPIMEGKDSVQWYKKLLNECLKFGNIDPTMYDYWVFHGTSSSICRHGALEVASWANLKNRKYEFETRTDPSLGIMQSVGSMFTGAVWVNLACLLLEADFNEKRRIMMYSYGSGAMATVFGLQMINKKQIVVSTKNEILKHKKYLTPEEWISGRGFGNFKSTGGYVFQKDDKLHRTYSFIADIGSSSPALEEVRVVKESKPIDKQFMQNGFEVLLERHGVKRLDLTLIENGLDSLQLTALMNEAHSKFDIDIDFETAQTISCSSLIKMNISSQNSTTASQSIDKIETFHESKVSNEKSGPNMQQSKLESKGYTNSETAIHTTPKTLKNDNLVQNSTLVDLHESKETKNLLEDSPETLAIHECNPKDQPLPFIPLIQLLCVIIVFVILCASIIPSGLFLNHISSRSFTIDNNWIIDPYLRTWGNGPGFAVILVVIIWMFVFSLVTILSKYLLIGTYRSGAHSLWSGYYLRWWIVDRLFSIWEMFVGIYFVDTPWLNLFYTILGSKVSSTSRLEQFFRNFDLVSIKSGAVVAGLVTPAVNDSRGLALLPCRVSKNTYLRKVATVLPGENVDYSNQTSDKCRLSESTSFLEHVERTVFPVVCAAAYGSSIYLISYLTSFWPSQESTNLSADVYNVFRFVVSFYGSSLTVLLYSGILCRFFGNSLGFTVDRLGAVSMKMLNMFFDMSIFISLLHNGLYGSKISYKSFLLSFDTVKPSAARYLSVGDGSNITFASIIASRKAPVEIGNFVTLGLMTSIDGGIKMGDYSAASILSIVSEDVEGSTAYFSKKLQLPMKIDSANTRKVRSEYVWLSLVFKILIQWSLIFGIEAITIYTAFKTYHSIANWSIVTQVLLLAGIILGLSGTLFMAVDIILSHLAVPSYRSAINGNAVIRIDSLKGLLYLVYLSHRTATIFFMNLFLGGTFFRNIHERFCGADIKNIFEPVLFGIIYDSKLLTFSNCVCDQYSVLEGHNLTAGEIKFEQTEMGNQTSLNPFANISGQKMDDHVTLASRSKVNFSKRLPKKKSGIYIGNPAVEIDCQLPNSDPIIVQISNE